MTALVPVEAPIASAPIQGAGKTAANDVRTREHATIIAEMRRQLLGAAATFDDSRITDVQTMDACHTRFVTADRSTVIEWAKAGNIAPRLQDGREINDLPAASGTHALSVPTGDTADGISGAVGLLAGGCASSRPD